jgi:hypothetical protein
MTVSFRIPSADLPGGRRRPLPRALHACSTATARCGLPDARSGGLVADRLTEHGVVHEAHDVCRPFVRARLRFEKRVALVAVVVKGMRYAELAAATGCAVGTAKSRVFRARDALHAMLLGPDAAPRRPSTSVPRAVGAARLPPRDGTLFDHGGGAP